VLSIAPSVMFVECRKLSENFGFPRDFHLPIGTGNERRGMTQDDKAVADYEEYFCQAIFH